MPQTAGAKPHAALATTLENDDAQPVAPCPKLAAMGTKICGALDSVEVFTNSYQVSDEMRRRDEISRRLIWIRMGPIGADYRSIVVGFGGTTAPNRTLGGSPMLSAPLAARELDRFRAERAAEAARQLPLHAETPPELIRIREDEVEDQNEDTAQPLPDWATNY